MVRRPRRSPTACEAARPAFAPPRRSLDRSFLGILSSALGQLQPPSPQIAVLPERPQNVMGSLRHQGAQVTVSFLADMELRLAAARIPAPRTQPQITSHVAAAAKWTCRIELARLLSRDTRADSHWYGISSPHLWRHKDMRTARQGDLLPLRQRPRDLRYRRPGCRSKIRQSV
jgi:hypothetical protein